MSVLFRRSVPASEVRSTYSMRQLGLMLGASASGMVHVDEESAMRHDAVWSCRTRIAQDVSMMPVDVVRYVNGERQEVSPTPQIVAAPSANVKALDWRYQVVDSWLGWGNAWGLVTQTTMNGAYPSRIELLHPGCVRWQRSVDGGLEFFVDNVRHQLWPVGDLWHEPAYTLPGESIGMSPVAFHARSISMGLTAEKFGADFMGDGGHPSAILGVDGDPGPEQAQALKDRLLGLTRGRRGPIVLPKAHTYTQLQVSPEDSQFLDTMRYSVEQVCRIYGEDPADHGSSGGGSALTYANRSDADLARLKRRQFWITKLQSALTDLLPRPQVVKLNTSAVLMMTDRERHEIHKLRLDSKTRTINEVRRIEDEAPFPDPEFDEPGIPAGSAEPVSPDGQPVPSPDDEGGAAA